MGGEKWAVEFQKKSPALKLMEEGFIISQFGLTHAPFWVQGWGLPFEYMIEEAGRDIGGKIGRVIEVDKRSWQADQAKFM